MKRWLVVLIGIGCVSLLVVSTVAIVSVTHAGTDLVSARRAAGASQSAARRAQTLLSQPGAALTTLQRQVHSQESQVSALSASWKRVSGPYPRGAFDWCPSTKGTLALDGSIARQAGEAAITFDIALHVGSPRALRPLVDTTIAMHTTPLFANPAAAVLDPARWFQTTTATGLRVTTYANARGFGPTGPATADPLVGYGCGPAVASLTWQVAVRDNSFTSSSRVLFFLVHRADGWRVWGSY